MFLLYKKALMEQQCLLHLSYGSYNVKKRVGVWLRIFKLLKLGFNIETLKHAGLKQDIYNIIFL